VTETRFLSRQEAAAQLGVPVETIDRLIAHGVLARYRIAGRWVRVEAGQVAELADLPREYLMRC
jgi:excisionase family DNA binding protein